MDVNTQKELKQLFYRNQDLFKATVTHISQNADGSLRGINYVEQAERLRKYGKFHWTWGRCFAMSQFVFYYLGGYQSPWELKCIKGISFKIKDYEGLTSHWFVQHRHNGTIIDLTREQFDGLLNIDEWYAKGKRANLGYSFYYVGNRLNKKYVDGNCVPSLAVLRFYELWREREHNEHLEKYFIAANSKPDVSQQPLF